MAKKDYRVWGAYDTEGTRQRKGLTCIQAARKSIYCGPLLEALQKHSLNKLQ